MQVRTLEALFSFKFDSKALKKAEDSVNSFSADVNRMAASFIKHMPLDVAVRMNKAGANRTKNQIENFASSINKIVAGVAGFFAVNAVGHFFNRTTMQIANIGKAAHSLGISTTALQEFNYAAEKSGVPLDILEDSLKEIQIRAKDAAMGSGEAAEALQLLQGFSPFDDDGQVLPVEDLIPQLADTLKELPQSDQLWVADALFGDQGYQMLKMLKDGSAGLKNMRQEAKELGYVMSDDTVTSAIKFRQAITKLKTTAAGMIRGVLKDFLPLMTGFMESFAAMWQSLSTTFAKLNKNTTVMRTAFIALGLVLTALAIKAAIAFAPMIAMGVLIAGVALIIDDLWVAFSGGDSVSKRVFEAIIGWFKSLKTWVLSILGRLWDFLPADLQKNLKAAFSLVKSFVLAYISVVTTILRRAWGFASDIFSTIFSHLKSIAAKIFDVLSGVLKNIGTYLSQILIDNITAAVSRIKDIILGIKNLISNAVPDFVKKGFSAAIDYVGGIGSKYDKKPSQRHLAPQASSSQQLIKNHSNQSVNVAVNVKTGANAHEIGGEASKALRKELEKERVNAFMGVTRYAS
jgi:hypothetical protein